METLRNGQEKPPKDDTVRYTGMKITRKNRIRRDYYSLSVLEHIVGTRTCLIRPTRPAFYSEELPTGPRACYTNLSSQRAGKPKYVAETFQPRGLRN